MAWVEWVHKILAWVTWVAWVENLAWMAWVQKYLALGSVGQNFGMGSMVGVGQRTSSLGKCLAI